MITQFHIENFRSLKDVTFECLDEGFFERLLATILRYTGLLRFPEC